MSAIRVLNLMPSLQYVDFCLFNQSSVVDQVVRLVQSLGDPMRSGVHNTEMSRPITIAPGNYQLAVVDAASGCASEFHLSELKPIKIDAKTTVTAVWFGNQVGVFVDADPNTPVSLRFIPAIPGLPAMSMGRWDGKFPVSMGEVLFENIPYASIVPSAQDQPFPKTDERGYWQIDQPFIPLNVAVSSASNPLTMNGYRLSNGSLLHHHTVFAIDSMQAIRLLDCDEGEVNGALTSCNIVNFVPIDSDSNSPPQ